MQRYNLCQNVYSVDDGQNSCQRFKNIAGTLWPKIESFLVFIRDKKIISPTTRGYGYFDVLACESQAIYISENYSGEIQTSMEWK